MKLFSLTLILLHFNFMVISKTILMNPRLNFENFDEMILSNETFVDKSLLIDEILKLNHSGSVILITRPKNWGKSLNLDMINKFFNIDVDENGTKLPDEISLNRMLFVKDGLNTSIGLTSPLKISNITKAMEHQGCHPVIFLRLGGLKANHYYDVITELKLRIGQLFRRNRCVKKYTKESQTEILEKYYHEEYDDISPKELNSSLVILSELFFKHFNKKVYVLVDDYDDPINTAFQNFGIHVKEFEKVVILFRQIFCNLFEYNPYLEKGIITGRFVLSKIFSKKDSKINRYTLLDEPFSKFFGFTESEVGEILTKKSLENNLAKIKKWYGGYHYGGLEFFNPWSTMQCIRNKGDIVPYWYHKSKPSVPLPNNVISSKVVAKLIQGGFVTMSVMKEIDYEICCAESVYSMSLFNGYLSPIFANGTSSIAPDNDKIVQRDLIIPNEEVKCIFSKGMVERIEMWDE